jgi:PAS domain S-box-containing protein
MRTEFDMNGKVEKPLKVSTKQISIIIVKPVEEERRKIAAAFTADNYNLFEAANGIDALNILRKHPIKLIVSDAMMPSLDGFRLCFEVKRSDLYRNIKFLMHSSAPLTDNDEELAKKFGVDSYIKDTGDSNEIIDNVNLLLKQSVQQNYPSLESMQIALDLYNKAILKTLKSDKQQTVQLKQSGDNRYQSVINQITDVYYRTNADGIITEISPSIKNFGYEVSDVVGINVLSFYINQSEREQLMQTAMRIGSISGYEVNLRRADGVPIVVQVSAQIVKNESGKLIGMEGVLHNLTDQKKVEKEIKEREKQYRLLFEEAPIAYMSLNENGNIIEENEALRNLIGYSQYEIEGRWFGDFLNPESIAVFRERFEVCKESLQHIKEEITLRNKSGAEINVIVDGKVIRNEDGRFLRTHCTLSDVTEYRKSKSLLTESENKYRNVFAAGADAMFLIDRQTGQIHDANDAASKMYGYTPEEFIKLKSINLSAEPEKSNEARISGLRHVPIRYHKRKNGEIFPTEITASYFTYVDKDVSIVNIRDISERIFADETIK